MIRYAIPALILLSGCAAGNDAAPTLSAREQTELDQALAGMTPGEPVHCINRNQVRELRKFRNTLLYVVSDNRVYRNNTTSGCSGLSNDDIVVSRSSDGSSYCRGDLIHTVAQSGGMMTGACALGDFIPYTRTPAQ